MTPGKLRQALWAGRGAALRQIAAAPRGQHDSLILDMTLHFRGWDAQVEGYPIWYILKLIERSKRPASVRKAVFARLRTCREHRTRQQLAHLAEHWARKGDRRAARAVEAVILRTARTRDGVPADDWLKRCGYPALLALVRAWGHPRTDFRRGDPDEFSASLKQAGTGRGGASAMLKRLTNARRSDRLVDAYIRRSERQTQFASARRSEPAVRWKPTFSGLVQWLAERQPLFNGTVASYVRQMKPEDQSLIWPRLLAELDGHRLLSWLWCFDSYAQLNPPHLDERLLTLARDPDIRVASAACIALRSFNDRRVREAVIALVDRDLRATCQGALEGLESTLTEDDDEMIAAAVQKLRLRDQVHSVGFSVLNLAKAAPTVRLPLSWRWCYEATPCSDCREIALRLLLHANLATSHELRDSQFDACASIRSMARKARRTVRQVATDPNSYK